MLRGACKRKCKRRKSTCILISLLLFIFFMIFIDSQIREFVKNITSKQAKIIANTSLNKAINNELGQENIDYSSLINIQKNSNGKVLAIDTNVQKVNQLKSKILLAVQEEIKDIDAQQIGIPLGCLTGTQTFDGHGPKLPLKISMIGDINANFRSDFSDAGINQTRHQIYLDIKVDMLATIPGYPSNLALETSVLVAETIIVGETPSVLANVK
jgi:sporulation protein YunB